jgi:hypothetical protein
MADAREVQLHMELAALPNTMCLSTPKKMALNVDKLKIRITSTWAKAALPNLQTGLNSYSGTQDSNNFDLPYRSFLTVIILISHPCI